MQAYVHNGQRPLLLNQYLTVPCEAEAQTDLGAKMQAMWQPGPSGVDDDVASTRPSLSPSTAQQSKGLANHADLSLAILSVRGSVLEPSLSPSLLI